LREKIIAVLGIIIVLLSGIAIAQIIATSKTGNLNDPLIYISLGDYLQKNGQEDYAVSLYEKALEIDPSNLAALNNLGYYYREKNPLLAEDYFRKALRVDPSYNAARNNLALLYHYLGNYRSSVEQFSILVETDPDNIQYNYDLAINLAKKFYHVTKSYDDLILAKSYFEKVYAKDKNFEHALDNIKVLDEIQRTIENR
jgi:type IV pilus assembly protein PilF